MKKKWLLRIVGIFVLSIIGLYVYFLLNWQPRLYKVTEPVVLDAGMRMKYFHFNYNPFQDDLVWITPKKPNRPILKRYLFDLKLERVTHIAENFTTIQSSRTYQSTLGTSFGSLRLFWRWYAVTWFDLRDDKLEDFFVLIENIGNDGKRKKFKTVRWVFENSYPSPNGRYNRILSWNDKHYIYDFEEHTLIDLGESSHLLPDFGWFSNRECFYRDSKGEINVYDIKQDKSTVLLKPIQLNAFLENYKLQLNQKVGFNVVSVPTGNGDRMIICGTERFNKNLPDPLIRDKDWVVEFEQESGELKLLHRWFPHKNHGKWNADLTKYIYPGQDGKNVDAVYLYDIEREELLTLEQGKGSRDEYSMPNFYGDNVIYVKDNALWMMKDDGTGKRQIFPSLH